MSDERGLGYNSVGYGPGFVNLWMLPLWLKGDKVVRAELTPKTARKIAIQLLQAADGAEAEGAQ